MIEFKNVNLSYGAQDVLIDTSFRIGRGERVGIVGPNGAGKSTLFQLILSECHPLGGSVDIEGRPRIGHVHQHSAENREGTSLLDYAMAISPELETLERNLHQTSLELQNASGASETERCMRELGKLQTAFEHVGGYDVEARVKAALCGLGFAPERLDAPFDSFSGGWRMRAELVRVLVGDPDILLLDEPSNYLDLPAVEWLQRFVRDYAGTLLLVSHDRFLLQSLTRVTLEVDAATVTRYEGDWRFYRRERAQRHAVRQATHRNIERQRAQMQRFVDRFRYQSSKASLVQSRIKALERLPALPLPARSQAAGLLRIAKPPHSGAEAIRLESAGFAYEPGKWIFRNLSFSLNRGDRAALVGFNGMGKTTLLRVMAGALNPTEGRVVTGHHVRIGYVSQALSETLPVERRLFNVLRSAAPLWSENAIRTLLGRFGFSGDTIDKPCGVLSGGERIRLAFATLYALEPNLLLLDEPTTHLDMEGREALENAISDYQGALCLVSHDIAFVETVANRVIALTPDGIDLYPGAYADFRQQRAAVAREPSTAAKAGEAPSHSQNPPLPDASGNARQRRRARADARAQRLPRIRELKRRIADLEAHIIAAESEQTECVNALQSGIVADHAGLNRRLAALQQTLENANREWEMLAEKLLEAESDED